MNFHEAATKSLNCHLRHLFIGRGVQSRLSEDAGVTAITGEVGMLALLNDSSEDVRDPGILFRACADW